MDVHLVDGTYELFRHFFAMPSHVTADGTEVAATRGVVGSVLAMLEEGATHVGVATDHVIESFRNDLWDTYKSSAGVPRPLLRQFTLLEDALEAAGIRTWPMVELEADDALAAAARTAAADDRVDRVLICTPDKDLGQCVGGKVFQFDRRKRALFDVDAVRAKFGVDPESIPDWLALVGDTADGFPGLAGWGAKSASAVLSRYRHLEAIPLDGSPWELEQRVSSPARLAAVLRDQFDLALLFRRIATVEADEPVVESVDDLEWTGPRPELLDFARRLDALGLAERAAKLVEKRFG
ncbi:MAG: 5'-3' exonuclease [Acidimicrobiales bacterium]